MKPRSCLGADFESRAKRGKPSRHEAFLNARVPKLLRIDYGICGSRIGDKTNKFKRRIVRNKSFLPGFFSKKPRTSFYVDTMLFYLSVDYEDRERKIPCGKTDEHNRTEDR